MAGITTFLTFKRKLTEALTGAGWRPYGGISFPTHPISSAASIMEPTPWKSSLNDRRGFFVSGAYWLAPPAGMMVSQ